MPIDKAIDRFPTPGALLGTVQVLRGVAATVVVLHHSVRAFTIYRPGDSMLPLPSLFGAKPFQSIGSIGVDIFFVISGVIMIFVSTEYLRGVGSAVDFIIRRLIRIYPMYILVTLLLCGVYGHYVLLKKSPPIYDLQWWRIFDSLLFFPSFNQKHEVAPIVGVGWTLYYEMYFYLCFATALVFARKAITICVLAIVTGAVIIARVAAGEDALSSFFQNTIVFEFVFGCALGVAFVDRRFFFQWSPVVFFVPAVVALPFLPNFANADFEFVFWGLPSVLIVAGVLSIEAHGGVRWTRAWLVFGDASYAIYLVHITVIYNVFYRLVLKITQPIGSGLVTDLAILLSVAVCVGVGVALNIIIEVPVRRRLRVWYQRVKLRLAAYSVIS